MLKVLIAHTYEIDDTNIAVSEVLSQLDIEKNLMKNSVGILSCYSEFIDSGVGTALSEKLPFDIIGGTTIASAVPGHRDRLLLTLTVFTSDDVFFSAAVTEDITPQNMGDTINRTYKEAASKLTEEPKLIFLFAPVSPQIPGDYIVTSFDKATGGIPLFGTVTMDHTTDYSTARTIFNGQGGQGISMVLLAGNVDFSFDIESISDSKILKQKAIITKSKDNILMSINNMTAIEYLNSIGLAINGKVEGHNSTPFILDFNDGTKHVSRSIFGLTPEGHAICAGIMPEGLPVSIGTLDHDEVVTTAKKLIQDRCVAEDNKFLYMFSCIVRHLVLGVDTMAEMDVIDQALKGKTPYSINYSGGEICPLIDENGKLINRFHNDTLICCKLK